jgi:hypothetical protein
MSANLGLDSIRAACHLDALLAVGNDYRQAQALWKTDL